MIKCTQLIFICIIILLYYVFVVFIYINYSYCTVLSIYVRLMNFFLITFIEKYIQKKVINFLVTCMCSYNLLEMYSIYLYGKALQKYSNCFGAIVASLVLSSSRATGSWYAKQVISYGRRQHSLRPDYHFKNMHVRFSLRACFDLVNIRIGISLFRRTKFQIFK